MKTDIRTTIHEVAQRAPHPDLDLGAIQRSGARRRRFSKVLRAVPLAVLIAGIIGSVVFWAPGPASDTASPDDSDPVTITNPDPPEDARQIVTSSIPGLGTFTMLFSGPTTEVIEGETFGMGCVHIIAPETSDGDVTIGGMTLCGEEIAPDVFGIYSYGGCQEATSREDQGVALVPVGGVVSILGLNQDESTTLRFTFDSGEPADITTDEIAALFAWEGDQVLTDIEISGKTADEIASAVDLPIGGCD